MTEAEILRLCELPAGRELNEAVGRHVLKSVWLAAQPAFSTDLVFSEIVLEHALEQGWEPSMDYSDINDVVGWRVYMHPCDGEVVGSGTCDTLPLAICRAALKAALAGKE